MIKRENEIRKEHIRFNGHDISMAALMIDKMSTTMDILYYLINRGEERSFVVMLVSANNIDIKKLLNKQKRDTDILFEIDKEKALYAMLCQDTKIDGGYRFAERVVYNLNKGGGEDIYLTELEVRTTKYDVKYIIFKLIETLIKSKQENRNGEIIFNTLH